MKRLFFTILCFSITGNLLAQSLTWKPLQPRRGDKVSFTYDPGSTPLASEKKVEAYLYSFNNSNNTADDVNLIKTGNVYTGSFVVDTGARVMALGFHSGTKKDPNGKDGYLISAFQDGKEVAGTGLAYNMIYDYYGKYLFDMESQPERALAAMEKEWNAFPENRDKNLNAYLNILNRIKKKEAEPAILAILDKRLEEGHFTEPVLADLVNWYGRLNQKEKAGKLSDELKKNFPNGNWKKTEAIMAINKAKDPVEKEAALQSFLAVYPPVTEQDKTNLGYYITSVANAYALNKEKRDTKKFLEYAGKLGMQERASLYNNVSWEFAQKELEPELSARISKEATLWAKGQVSKPTGKKPDMTPVSEWQKNRSRTYGMYADTYAFILYKQKDYQNGVAYAREGVAIQEFKNAEYNDRYALLLEKTATPEQVQKEMEPLLEAGNAGKDTKEVLRRALVKTLQSEAKADERILSLSKISLEKAREELVKTMLHEEAPGFKLKNLAGNEISLASLKGKVVVLDFWATWCGPCIASFPGMQKAVEKYQHSNDVVFLFIDTWESQETEDQRKKEVTDFIRDKKYSFNVLYDDKDGKDQNNYVVVSKYKVEGIPTKFIIGKDGNIRFKSVGYNGNNEKLVDELSSMIELAGK